MSNQSNVKESRAGVGLYLAALVMLVLSGIVGVLTVEHMRPDRDNTQLHTTILGFLVPTIGVILTVINSHHARTKATEAHQEASEARIIVNGRMQALIDSVRTSAYAEGMKAGRDEFLLLYAKPPSVTAVITETPLPVPPPAPSSDG